MEESTASNVAPVMAVPADKYKRKRMSDSQYISSLESHSKQLRTRLKKAKVELQQERERVEKYRKMAEHYHVAKYIDGELTDECGECGLDLRDEVHRRDAALEKLTG